MKFRYLTLGVALMAGLPAHAHEAKGSHGGRIADAGPYHAELVAKDKVIEIFLTGENDKPVDPNGFKGVAIFSLGGKAERIPLTPSEKNLRSSMTPCGVCAYFRLTTLEMVERCIPISSATSLSIIGLMC